jgi:hypothetical protein
MASQRNQLLTLKRLLSRAELVLPPDPSNARCRESLAAASALTSDLLKINGMPAAAVLGQRGGTVTAKRGSEYFRQTMFLELKAAQMACQLANGPGQADRSTCRRSRTGRSEFAPNLWA